MITQMVAVLLLLLGWERFPLLLGLGELALWAVMATALGSAVNYFWRFSRAEKRARTVDFAAASRDRALRPQRRGVSFRRTTADVPRRA